MSSPTLRFECPKCHHTAYETAKSAPPAGLVQIFDVQNRKLTTVTCEQCRYTELYAADSSRLGHIFDLFTG